MTSREKVNRIINRENIGEGTFWTGHPNDETVPIYAKEWGIESTHEAVYSYLGDDCRWFPVVDWKYKFYNHPDGRTDLDPWFGIDKAKSHGGVGCFAEVTSIAEIEAYPWPDTKYIDFSEIYKMIDQHQDKMVFTGLWCCFFHDLCGFFGMENYFCKMYTDPEIVQAATEKIVEYYVAASEIFFEGLGDRADAMFFGNDFGTQQDLFIAPEKFREFVLPPFKKFIEIGKKYGKKTMLHSCGSIYRIIPDLIDAGLDVIHPIQAQAVGMSAKELVQFKDDITFMGGLDAQSFFVNATPQEVEDEVKRVMDILGPGIIMSPSHEEILPNVPAANVLAMARAAKNHKY